MGWTSIELCAGAGGQALGLEQAGFDHLACVEIDPHACDTLRLNRPEWNVIQADLNDWEATAYRGQVDLLAGGVPCPPFSIAGKQLGHKDERDLFPAMLRVVSETQPRAVMVENVKGLLGSKFEQYREKIERQLKRYGYVTQWKLLNAADFGVPQLRPRTVLVALKPNDLGNFTWPVALSQRVSVGDALVHTMIAAGFEQAELWAAAASDVAPTLVGGSKKHGGADLGPTRARAAWARIGVDGRALANDVPEMREDGMIRLTVKQAAILQGFPTTWRFSGRKTAAYRQVGNAFPPPVANAVARQIKAAMEATDASRTEVVA